MSKVGGLQNWLEGQVGTNKYEICLTHYMNVKRIDKKGKYEKISIHNA